MGIRIYHLLRSNKKQGPFTAEELIQQNLRPFDLIWIDGRSAAWSYPGELPEFKMYAPLPGEQNAQINKQQNSATVSPSVQAAIAVNDNIASPAIKQKPRYKVSAAWSKIQTITNPVYKEVLVAEPQTTPLRKNAEIKQPVAVQQPSLSWEEAWLDWKKEEKTVEPIIEFEKAKPVVAPEAKTINENYVAPALERKYSESLDSLKDKYIDNVLRQKQKAGKSFSFGKASEFVLPSIALLVIFSVGYWLLHDTNGSMPINLNEQKPIQTAAVHNTNEPATTTADNTVSNTNPQPGADNKQNMASVSNPAITDQAKDRKPNYTHTAKLSTTKQDDNLKPANNLSATKTATPDPIASSPQKISKAAKQFDPSVINNVPTDNAHNDPSATAATGDLNAADNRPVRRRTNATDNNEINPSSQKSEPAVPKNNGIKTTTSYVSVPELIQMSDGSADLKIENISDVNLDLVVVDVQYYDASNNFRKGETLYVHNLKAGKNVIIKTPKDMNSLYATSKISLVSSDANNLYIVGDN
jgi:hypothetical protein